ncbi:hypothetical protein EDB81DRAFT_861027 [Dactylonectria macrodidyma]|uniref:Uncharacterized protein n=1 Tax=Dactylonectria macrodidyma TaxID=307937 RepID=A0A9P9DTL6_9HYPO|nr:hypothetical protein EDB81DRAFT_861027 [Dactylonectria macrodidyma]
MSPTPDPFSLQFGIMSPRGSVTAWVDESPPPLPPRPNMLTLQSSRLPVPVATSTARSLSDEATQPSPDTSLRFSDSHMQHERGIPHPAPTATSARRSSWRSTLGQVAQSASFGGPIAFPQASSFANNITVNGVELGQADVLSLQGLLGAVIPGNYWYDRRSGAYGSAGGPCTGFLVAGLALGNGQLDQHASGNTGTDVFINGREIHAVDALSLQAMGVPVRPGRWWVNGDGSFGMEGSPIPLGNLRLQAMANPGAGGGTQSWSTSMGHYGGSDGQGFTYVGGPGWSHSSG